MSYHAIHIKVTRGVFHHPRPTHTHTHPMPKLSGPGYINYQVCDVWVTILFTQKVTEGMFRQLPPTPTPVPKLSGLGSISYQVYDVWLIMISTQKSTEGIFHQLPSPRIRCQSYQDEVHKLWGLLCVSYHAIHTIVRQLPFPLRSPMLSGQGYISYQVCNVWVIMLLPGYIWSTPPPPRRWRYQDPGA